MITALDPRTALVIIDLQNATANQPLATPAATIVDNANQLITAFRQANLPVVIVNVDPPQTTIRREVKPKVSGPLPAEALALLPDLETGPGDLRITKHNWGAFYETPLHDELQKRGITGIVLAGISTSRGVESTARQANERGYNVTFAQDAMTDGNASAHENSLKIIFPSLGEVGDTGAVIAFLNR